MAVTRRVRFEILRRDGYACKYCGAKAPDVALTVDHVIPQALGGGDEPSNLVAACQPCNAGKSSTSPDQPLVADVEASAATFAKALDLVAKRHRENLADTTAQVDTVMARWNDWIDGDLVHIPSPHDARLTVENFLHAGLGVDELYHFIDYTMRTSVAPERLWRYFCGCCWGAISDRQKEARRMVEAGEV